MPIPERITEHKRASYLYRGKIALLCLSPILVCGALYWPLIYITTPGTLLPGPPTIPDVSGQYALKVLAVDGKVTAVCFSADNRYVIAGTRGVTLDRGRPAEGGTLAVWEAATGKQLQSITLDQSVTALSPHPDGRRLLIARSYLNSHGRAMPDPEDKTGGQLAVLTIPDLKTMEEVVFDDAVAHARFSPDGKTAAAVLIQHWEGARDQRLKRGPDDIDHLAILDADSLETRHVTGKPYDIYSDVAFSLDSKWIYTVDSSRHVTPEIKRRPRFHGGIRKIEVGTGAVSPALGEELDGKYIEMSPDGKELMSTMSWKMDVEREVVTSFPPALEPDVGGWFTMAAVYSPDNRSLLIARSANMGGRRAKSKALLMDRLTGKLTGELLEHTRNVTFTACAYAPDGKRFAIGSDPCRDRPNDPYQGRVFVFTKIAP